MTRSAFMGAALRNGENYIEKNREDAAGHGGHRFSEEVDNGDQEERQCYQSKPNRDLDSAKTKIEGHLKLALTRFRVPQDEYRESIHGKAPDDTKSVEIRQECDVAATDKDGQYLQAHDDIDDPVARAEPGVRLAEPVAENAILGDSIEDAIGAHDGRVDCSRQDERSHDNNETVKDQSGNERTLEVHRQAANQILQETLPHIVRNDHYGEERNQ